MIRVTGSFSPFKSGRVSVHRITVFFHGGWLKSLENQQRRLDPALLQSRAANEIQLK